MLRLYEQGRNKKRKAERIINMNSCIFTGRITADPELRQTPSNVSVCRFSVAVQRNFKNKDGGYDADFITCVAWRAQAEFVSKYFSKGSAIQVRGAMQNANYTDANGVKHYAMECLVDHIEFGMGKKEDSKPQEQNAGVQMDMSGFEEIFSDGDVPF